MSTNEYLSDWDKKSKAATSGMTDRELIETVERTNRQLAKKVATVQQYMGLHVVSVLNDWACRELGNRFPEGLDAARAGVAR